MYTVLETDAFVDWVVIMMIGGGDKSSRSSDIEAAKAIAKELTQ